LTGDDFRMDREHPRYAVGAAVTIRHGATATEGRTTNVSRGGLCALLPDAIPVGTPISVELKLVFDGGATSDSFAVAARVVWATRLDDAHQIGVAFRAVEGDQARYLDVLLRHLADVQRRAYPESDPTDLFRG
jgi:hypothetical protein